MDSKITAAIDAIEQELNCSKPAGFRTVKHDDLVLCRDALVMARNTITAIEQHETIRKKTVIPPRVCYNNDFQSCTRYKSTSKGQACEVCGILKPKRF